MSYILTPNKTCQEVIEILEKQLRKEKHTELYYDAAHIPIQYRLQTHLNEIIKALENKGYLVTHNEEEEFYEITRGNSK